MRNRSSCAHYTFLGRPTPFGCSKTRIRIIKPLILSYIDVNDCIGISPTRLRRFVEINMFVFNCDDRIFLRSRERRCQMYAYQNRYIESKRTERHAPELFKQNDSYEYCNGARPNPIRNRNCRNRLCSLSFVPDTFSPGVYTDRSKR